MAAYRAVLILLVLRVTGLVPTAYAAAAGTVVVAQGVDPTTLDPQPRAASQYGVARRLDWKARGDERIKGYDMALRAGGAR